MRTGLKKVVDDGSWLALMSPFLPNLERLHLSVPAYPYGLGTMLQYVPNKMKSADALSPFSSLAEVSLASVDDIDCPSFLLLDVFGLPSLRKFSGVAIIECSDDDDAAIMDDDSTSGFSAVTHVEFQSSHSDVCFRYLIRACARLESFTYEIGIDDNYDEDPAFLYRELYQHRNTLEEVTLSKDPRNNLATDDYQLLGSFSEFFVLKRICLRAGNLLRPDGAPLTELLPSSLESLSITEAATGGANEKLAQQLKDVISVAGARFPRLTRLRIQDPWDEDTEMDDTTYSMAAEYEAIVSLKHDCWDAGIDYCIANWDVKGCFWKERHRALDRSSCSRPHFPAALLEDNSDMGEIFSGVCEDAHG
ncbi:hypothetical protein PHISP_06219 [Aspergillus sp. HF37]|nr:hypothetical protein PHISP_06219 [Aspergillus sp. HF37]